jgi:hypothetical protein
VIKIWHVWSCSVCEHLESADHVYHPGDLAPVPDPPKGWHVIDGRVYCDRHEVKIVVLNR